MKLGGFLIVFGCLFVGELVIYITKLPLPPSIIGLIVLFGLLQSKKVKLAQVQTIAKTLLDYLAFLVLPACVSIMQYLDIIKADLLPLVVGTTLSTLLVMFVTGAVHGQTRVLLKKWAIKQKRENK